MKNSAHKFFCRTYYKDAERLPFLLRSIEKFATGFEGIVITCPDTSFDVINSVVEAFAFAEVKRCNSLPDDFIGQQITKLTAPRYTDADIIVHIDSDCVFTRNFSVSDLYHDGKLALFHAPYNYFYQNNHNCPWQTVTSKFLKQQVDLEFMRQFPLSYPRNLYLDLEKWFKDNHGYEIDDIHKHVSGDYLSEFNILGAYSYYSPKDYHLHVNQLKISAPSFVRQMCLIQSRENRSIPESELSYLTDLLA